MMDERGRSFHEGWVVMLLNGFYCLSFAGGRTHEPCVPTVLFADYVEGAGIGLGAYYYRYFYRGFAFI